MHSRLTLCAFLPALLQALQPARAPPARPVSTRARATVMANSLTTISANNLKMTDNIKRGAPRPFDTARRPRETPARRGEKAGEKPGAEREPTPPRAGTSKRRSAASSRSTPACPRDATPT